MTSISGGKNTSLNGIKFEKCTCNIPHLIENGFLLKKYKKLWYLKKQYGFKIVRFIHPNIFKQYIFDKFNINVYRKPDEIYLINEGNEWTLKIIEKKYQSVCGSVEDKLLAGPAYKREYQKMFPEFNIEYIFVVNEFLANKILSKHPKYKSLRIFLKEFNIKILFGEHIDYFIYINKWILE